MDSVSKSEECKWTEYRNVDSVSGQCIKHWTVCQKWRVSVDSVSKSGQRGESRPAAAAAAPRGGDGASPGAGDAGAAAAGVEG